MKTKIKKVNGWKVLAKDRTSISCSVYALNYPVNVEVKPKVKKSKLFFFNDLDKAVQFSNRFMISIVVPCIATNPSLLTKVAKWTLDTAIFWEDDEFLETAPAPEGTFVADSITCLE